MNNNKKIAIDLFVKNNKKYNFNDIKKIKKIHLGYTNISYFFLMKDNNKFQIRIAKNNDIVDRSNEQEVLKAINDKQYLYYDKCGNSIKKWIDGETLKKKIVTIEIIKKINQKIEKLHSTNIEKYKIRKHDYTKVLESKNINKKYLELYKNVLDITKTSKWVLSHNDLNCQNILSNNQDIYFIDFEWSRINYEGWDLANFLREVWFSFKKLEKIACSLNLNYLNLIKIIYISLCFAQEWAINNKLTFKILLYRIKNKIKLIKTYYQLKKMLSLNH